MYTISKGNDKQRCKIVMDKMKKLTKGPQKGIRNFTVIDLLRTRNCKKTEIKDLVQIVFLLYDPDNTY